MRKTRRHETDANLRIRCSTLPGVDGSVPNMAWVRYSDDCYQSRIAGTPMLSKVINFAKTRLSLPKFKRFGSFWI